MLIMFKLNQCPLGAVVLFRSRENFLFSMSLKIIEKPEVQIFCARKILNKPQTILAGRRRKLLKLIQNSA